MDLTTFAFTLIAIAGVYLAVGLIFCVLLFLKGLSNIDPNTKGAGIGFKLLIIPGLIAFWPFIWKKWRKKIMILEHRRRHFRIWIVLTLLLPAAFGLAWSVIPDSFIEPENRTREIDLRVIQDVSGTEIELKILTPVASPGNLVLISPEANSKFEDCQIIGQVMGEGIYRFKLPEDFEGNYVLLYNPYSEKITQSLKL